ncbi:hypothetical protein [Citrobacter amalonaticus]|uniref:hypothetical protein n=1 Tax=Citrobacter amalonaticus TaxID=35703 RepID=UPI002259B1B5|nr:hypothetical protein [Citrobacter amalonaticus]MCX3397054.1 hypothetical protein [Citrobacter amalonaticus]MDQ2176401.1 hypothetical protein [Citrobacter amalonaticus]MEC5725001.1 hypothetical protein [Citrobacter amalonaticus]
MLTVKVMETNGSEELYETKSVGWNAKESTLHMMGFDMSHTLVEGEVAYVMNENGKTISWYGRKVQQ